MMHTRTLTYLGVEHLDSYQSELEYTVVHQWLCEWDDYLLALLAKSYPCDGNAGDCPTGQKFLVSCK